MTYNYIIIGIEPDQQRPNQFKQLMAPCQDLDVLYQFIARMTKFEVFILTPCEESEEQWRAAVAKKEEEQERELYLQLKEKFEAQTAIPHKPAQHEQTSSNTQHCDANGNTDKDAAEAGPIQEADIPSGLRSV